MKDNTDLPTDQCLEDENVYRADASPFTLFFEGGFLYLYPKPSTARCDICRRHVSALQQFGHELLSIHGGRLQINYREADIWEYRNTWECRECSQREGPLWEVEEEYRIGRGLTVQERTALRRDKERELEAFFVASMENEGEYSFVDA